MTTYFVSTTGNDNNPGNEDTPWRTIAYAVNQLLPQDTLLIRGGVYTELVEIGRSGVTLAPITIAAYPGEQPIIDCATVSMPRWYGILHVSASHVIIDGLTVRNSQMDHNRGINVHGVEPDHKSSGVAIRNCTVYNISEVPILLSYVDNCVVEGCLIYNSQLEFAPDKRIKSDWGAAGVVLTRSSSNCTMRRCTTYGGWGEAVLLDMEANYCIVEECVFYDMWAPVYIHRSQNNIIRRNFIYTTTKEDGVLSRGIAFANEQATAGQFQSLDGLLIENNIVVGASIGISGGTIENEPLQNITIRHNTVVNSSAWEIAFEVPMPCHNVIVENNIFKKGNGTLGAMSPNAGVIWRSNCWSEQPPQLLIDSRDTISDPRLINPTASILPGAGAPENYQLTVNSPCVNRALPSAIANDLWGTARNRVRNDIGAHEFISF